MKKILLLSLFITLCALNVNCANALNTKADDYEIIENNEQQHKPESIAETDLYIIHKVDDKYGFFSKVKNKPIMPLFDSYEHISNNDSEFKTRLNNLVGYLNINTDENFLANFDDISVFNKYLKVKKDGKYGLTDRSGNIILPPAFQKIAIIESQGEEYIAGKQDGKYRIFKKTGEQIPDDQLYIITNDGSYALANDMQPKFKESYLDNKTTLYEKAEFDTVFEIQELTIPKKVKVKNLSEKIKTAEPIKNDEIIIGKKKYYIVNNDNKLGLNTEKGNEIVPAIYDELKTVKPCKHFKNNVIVARIGSNQYTIYDKNGHILSKKGLDKAIINLYGNKYNYIYNNKDDIWELYLKNKKLGKLKITDDKYEFKKQAFHIHNLHKVNELLLTE